MRLKEANSNFNIGDMIKGKSDKKIGKIIDISPEGVYWVKWKDGKESDIGKGIGYELVKESKQPTIKEAKKGTYTGRKIKTPDFDEYVLIGKISGNDSSGKDIYDIHEIIGGVNPHEGKKIGELKSDFIKKYIKQEESKQLKKLTIKEEIDLGDIVLESGDIVYIQKEQLKEDFGDRFKKGDKVVMSDDALDNYGEMYKNEIFTIVHVAYSTKDHPGYDEGMKGDGLYDLKVSKTGKDFGSSLYGYELKKA